jgi:hypothetical protein
MTRTTTLSGFVSLFASSSTLLCCALPALMVAVGAGAALAGLATSVPALVWFSEQKELTFGFTFLMLVPAGFLQWRARSEPCPIDPKAAAHCMRSRRFSARVYLLSVAIFCIGLLFAYVLPFVSNTQG